MFCLTMNKSLIAIQFLVVFSLFNKICIAEKIRFISTERPEITFYNKKLVPYLNMTSRRHSREDPFYYVDLNFETLFSFGNNVTAHFYFYESWSTTFRQTMLEMHLKCCDLITKNLFFGTALRQGKLRGSCPFPAGVYNLSNMTIPVEQIPKSFPIRRGRIYSNVTLTLTGEVVASAYIDMEIKTARIKKN